MLFFGSSFFTNGKQIKKDDTFLEKLLFVKLIKFKNSSNQIKSNLTNVRKFEQKQISFFRVLEIVKIVSLVGSSSN